MTTAAHRATTAERTARIRSRRTLRAADLLAVVWAGVWISLAVVIGEDVASLQQVSTTLSDAGGALVSLGHGLRDLSHVPIIGGTLGQIASRILATGTRASSTSRSSGASTHQLSYLLPIVVALVPIVPVLAVYVPVRVQRVREARAVRRALAQRGAEAGRTAGEAQGGGVETYLARRAVAMLPYHQLRKVSGDPWDDLESGRVRALAEAELRRLGIDPGYRLGPSDEPAAR